MYQGYLLNEGVKFCRLIPLFYVLQHTIIRFFHNFCPKIWINRKIVVPLHSNRKDILHRPKRNGQRWGATREE